MTDESCTFIGTNFMIFLKLASYVR